MRGVELGLPLGYKRLGGLPLGLALGHQALRGLDADERPLQLRLGLPELRLQDGRVHFRQDLAGADEVTLVDQDLPDPACGLGRDIDLDRLDPAVSGGESVGQVLRLKMPPSPNAQPNDNRSGDASNTCFNELFHVLDCSTPVGSLTLDHCIQAERNLCRPTSKAVPYARTTAIRVTHIIFVDKQISGQASQFPYYPSL